MIKDSKYYDTVKTALEKLLRNKGAEAVELEIKRGIADLRKQLERAKQEQKESLQRLDQGLKPTFKWNDKDITRYYNIDNYKARIQEKVDSLQVRLNTALLIAEEFEKEGIR